MDSKIITNIYNKIKNIENKDIESFLLENKDEESYLYLSRQRQNVLSIVDFSKEDEVLEISLDCGNLTSKYLNEVKSTTILYSTEEQKQINRIMNLNSDKVSYLSFDNLLLCKKTFSKIIICGFVSELDFKIKTLKKLLQKDGEIILIINNKYSIKYFSGEKDKNFGSIFSTIENDGLYSAPQIREIVDKLNMKCKFFYPLPNYYFAYEIFSEDFLPNYGSIKNISTSYFGERFVLFDDSKALNEAIKTNCFEMFAPSFLVKVRL